MSTQHVPNGTLEDRLHDGPMQTLCAAAMALESGQYRRGLTLVSTAIDEIRSELRGESATPKQGVHDVIAEASNLFPSLGDVVITGSVTVSASAEHALARAVREAVVNAAKHAAPGSVEVHLTQTCTQVQAQVRSTVKGPARTTYQTVCASTVTNSHLGSKTGLLRVSRALRECGGDLRVSVSERSWIVDAVVPAHAGRCTHTQ